jgi:putative intracellular protease/amidase
LMVAGGCSTGQAAEDRDFVHWVANTAGSARPVTSICTGAWLLAPFPARTRRNANLTTEQRRQS